MKKLLCCVSCCLMINIGLAQFQHSFGTEQSEMGRSLTQLQKVEKGYLVAGYTSRNFIGSLEATLVKTDLNGNQIWSRVYGGQDFEYFNSVRQSTNFSPNNPAAYVAAGITRSFGFGGGDALLIGTNVNGAPVFSKVYGRDQYDAAHCVQNIKDENGRPGYIMVGETRSYSQSLPRTNMYVVRTDDQGNLTRATVIGGKGDQRGLWIEQTRDGGYIITGSSTDFDCGGSATLVNPPTDIFVVKLKPDLNIEWQRVIGYPKELDPMRRYLNLGTCIKQGRDGNYVLTGYTNSFGINNSFDAFLMYLRSNGDFMGMKTYGTERNEYGRSLQITASATGSPLYTIVGDQFTSTRKALLFQADAGGNFLWGYNYGRTGQEMGTELVRDDFDKGFAFTGYTTTIGAGATDIYLVETTDTGKSTPQCEREIKLEVFKHEPCLTKIAEQIFVDEFRKIDPKVIRMEYKQDRCGIAISGKTDDIKDINEESGVSLFPNPAKNLLTIDVKRTSKTTYGGVFDIQGKEVIQNIQIGETGKTIVATETLEPGVYIVKLKTENGETLVKKFFKE